jgi:hypothetical protein
MSIRINGMAPPYSCPTSDRLRLLIAAENTVCLVNKTSTGRSPRWHPFVWTKTPDEILKKANRCQNFKRDH